MFKHMILALIILVLIGCNEEVTNTVNLEQSEETVKEKAMILIGNEFGNTYFEMKDALEVEGFEVITVGVGSKEYMSSCPNHENIEVKPDLDISEITVDNISEYDVLFIPAGKHHRTIWQFDIVADYINLCKDNDIVISSVCAGNIVLAKIDGLINGKHIAASLVNDTDIKNAGGIPKYQDVVADGLFITADKGGGKTGNSYKGAPVEALAKKIREHIDSTGVLDE